MTNSLRTKKSFFASDAFKKTIIIAGPAMIESFFVSFAGLVDTLMVSSLGSNAVAAVALTTQPKFLGLALFFALGVSSSAVVARRFGEDRRDDANNTVLTALGFTFLSVAAISLFFVFMAEPIIKFCGSSENTHKMAVEYLKIIMGGMIFNAIQIVINSAQRGAGNTKITMYTNVTSNTVNIIFNYLLIGGRLGFPALGVRGAAIATVFGTVVSCVMSIASLFRKDGFLSFKFILLNKIKPSVKSFLTLCRFGYSIFIEQLLLRIGFSATAIMAAKTGDAAMAAHQVSMSILSISFAFGDGLQSAAVALIGRSLGAKKPELAKLYGKTCQKVGGMISLILTVLFILGAETIMGWFFKDELHIVKIGMYLMWLMVPIMFFQVRQIIYMGCLRGAGDTFYTATVAVVCVTVLRTVVSYVFGFVLDFGIFGVWMGVTADQLGRYILSFLRFRKGKWTNIKI